MSPRAGPIARIRQFAEQHALTWVRRRSHQGALEDLLAEHLPPLQAKLRPRVLAELARRVVPREGELDLFFEHDQTARIVAMVLHLRHVLPALQDEHDALTERYDRVAQLHDQLASAHEQRQLLAEHLRRTVHGRWRLRRDRAALHRHLDLEAIKERHDRERHDRLAMMELALDFIAGAVSAVGEADTSEADSARALLRDSDLPEFLLRWLARSTRWQTRRAATAALESLVRTAAPLSEEGEAQLRDRVGDRHEHPWVVANALDVLWAARPDQARAVVELRLRRPRPDPRDFLVRRLLVDRVHREPRWALRLLGEPALLEDPAEHVREGLARAARRLLPAHPEALDVLARILGATRPAPEPRLTGDPSPRVRAIAGRALIQMLGARASEPEGQRLFEPALDLSCAWLEHERGPLPLQIACTELRAALEVLAEDPGPDLQQLDRLAPALVELSAAEDVPAAVHEAAAITLEALDRTRSPDRRLLLERLRSALDHSRVPGSRRITLPSPPRRQDVGRALAELTHADWGVSASISGRRLRLHRGDRFVTRLWRILHELRHPAPNKRQGHRHTVGRVLAGRVRAHSGQLHEVTPTVVPGERVHIPREGGWGRHVPSVDDLTTLPVLRPRPVEIYSSFGITRLRATGSILARLRSRARLALRYAELATQRSASLDAAEPAERQRYLRTLRDRYGIDVQIEPSPPLGDHPRRLPARITTLLPAALPPLGGGLASAPDAPALLHRLGEWIDTHAHYFLSMRANDQASLATFFVGTFALLFGDSYRRRRAIDRARRQIPLCIGGWGTRGKSGTERIKAGLFHGLGYQVFSKTTGCEAMLIHSIPEGPAAEIFVFRPYGKATIWEQRNLLELGAALRADVFLWECMALNPRYVEILQHEWMRDDLSTLTNAYPDHEDIQGPAGIDVAETISRFIPRGGTVITSEINFLPLFREVSRRHGSELLAIDPHEGELIAPELLDLFPYQEHPRNIALVARMAEQLGIDRDLAIVTMADHVVPDLGALKTYPPVRVEGRVLEFINGCSANERAGFLGNWERTGCAALADSDDPTQLVITVVNNRDDRISRSEVFARILVGDTVVDRHVLIGTNLRGLRSYLRDSLAAFLRELPLLTPADFESPSGPARAADRLDALMRRLRIAAPTPEALLDRLRAYAAGCGLEPGDTAPLRDALEAALASDGPLELPAVRRALEHNASLHAALDRALTPGSPPPDAPPEVLGPCDRAQLDAHFVRQLARAVIRARLGRQLDAALARGSARDAPDFEARVRDAYRILFDDMLVVVEDPNAKGDAIIEICARCVPPGTHTRIMGTQNIKGTGLDFVYRWVAVDAVVTELRILEQTDDHRRHAALGRLVAFADHGMLDLGLLQRFLRDHEPQGLAERAMFDRLHAKVAPALAQRKAARRDRSATASSRTKGWLQSVAGWAEGWLDFIDGARRFHASASVMNDLVHGRISHPRAAIVMREIYAREKGGWLLARLTRDT